MENITKEKSKSGLLGKISLAVGIINILLIVLICTDIKHNLNLPGITIHILGLLLLTGIVTGIAAFIKHRFWIGLAVNFLISLFVGISLLIIIFYATYATVKSLGLLP